MDTVQLPSLGRGADSPSIRAMALTRIDCFFWNGPQAHEGRYIALNPRHSPGCLIVAGSEAGRESIGGQVASKMALEQFAAGALTYFQECPSPTPGREPSLEALERAFKEANSSVYEFGHKLAAGGRLAASLFGLVIDSRLAAAGRVGDGGAYLGRGGELFPFFDTAGGGGEDTDRFDRGVGLSSVVTVELASVALQPDDSIFIFSRTLQSRDEHALLDLIRLGAPESFKDYTEFMQNLCDDSDDIVYASLCRIGPETVYLDRGLRAV
ncbi:MAG: hypothetical protein QY326_07800 [Bdellovibrionota bacterium]|nr:MAG: hypothetical protein QY326_07800 [Bdellovibrionota bacterium]